jgi:hypothetical protein
MDERRPSDWASGRISRRKALKRVAAGTALAWSAPVLTSISTTAFAQYGGPCPECPPLNCAGPVVECATGCFCVPLEEGGGCFCAGTPLVCTGPGFGDICDTDADCEALGFAGHRCVRMVAGSCPQCDPTGNSLCARPCTTGGGSSEAGPEVRAISR